MSYVVGFIDNDDIIKRSFLAPNVNGIKTALSKLYEDNGDIFNEDDGWWLTEEAFETENGVYFILIGVLEID